MELLFQTPVSKHFCFTSDRLIWLSHCLIVLLVYLLIKFGSVRVSLSPPPSKFKQATPSVLKYSYLLCTCWPDHHTCQFDWWLVYINTVQCCHNELSSTNCCPDTFLSLPWPHNSILLPPKIQILPIKKKKITKLKQKNHSKSEKFERRSNNLFVSTIHFYFPPPYPPHLYKIIKIWLELLFINLYTLSNLSKIP